MKCTLQKCQQVREVKIWPLEPAIGKCTGTMLMMLAQCTCTQDITINTRAAILGLCRVGFASVRKSITGLSITLMKFHFMFLRFKVLFIVKGM